jgi:MFS transporter, MHS family, proline/betaine transporter
MQPLEKISLTEKASSSPIIGTKPSALKKVILSCMVGNALEWYDFALYGYFVNIIGQLFFPPSSDSVSLLLKSYGLFFVGFVMRPLGAIFFGYIGDRHGRKKALMLSIYMMAIPTAAIGFLPTYAHIGLWAPLLLTVCRLFQGLSMGGEFTGSMIFIVEHADQKRRGFWGSWSSFSVLVGLTIGSGICALMSRMLSAEEMLSWGWRVPFMISILGSVLGSYMRKSLSDPAEYLKNKEVDDKKFSLAELFQKYTPEIFKVVLVDLTISVGFFLVCIFIMTYLEKFAGLSYAQASLINTLSMLVFAAMIPLAGHLSDLWGRKKVMMIAATGFFLFSVPLFLGLSSGHFITALISQMILAGLMGINFAPIPAFLVEIFPARVRYSGVSIAHNLSMMIFGGTAPQLVTYCIDRFDLLIFPGIYLSLAAVGALAGLLWVKDRSQSPLR